MSKSEKNPFDKVAKRRAEKRPEPQSKSKLETQAKRTNPEYTKLGVYIPKDLHHKVKVKAVTESLELSKLVETLLTEWLGD